MKVRFRPTGWISIAGLIVDRPVASMGHLVDLSIVAAHSANYGQAASQKITGFQCMIAGVA